MIGLRDEKELFLDEEGATQRFPPDDENRLQRRAPATRDPRELEDLEDLDEELEDRDEELDLENQLLEEEDDLDDEEDLEDQDDRPPPQLLRPPPEDLPPPPLPPRGSAATWWKCKTRTRRQTRRDSRNMFLDFFFFLS